MCTAVYCTCYLSRVCKYWLNGRQNTKIMVSVLLIFFGIYNYLWLKFSVYYISEFSHLMWLWMQVFQLGIQSLMMQSYCWEMKPLTQSWCRNMASRLLKIGKNFWQKQNVAIASAAVKLAMFYCFMFTVSLAGSCSQ